MTYSLSGRRFLRVSLVEVTTCCISGRRGNDAKKWTEYATIELALIAGEFCHVTWIDELLSTVAWTLTTAANAISTQHDQQTTHCRLRHYDRQGVEL